ncbi:unnamed protein product, partial [Mesorhabditis spiculigera]
MSSKIRILFPRNPPDVFDDCKEFPTYAPTIECLFPGWTLEIIMTISQALQLTVEPVFMEGAVGEVNWGTLANGSWEGALQYLQQDKVDVIALLFQQTDVRAQYFDYSYPVTYIQQVLNVREIDATGEISIWDAMKPYQNPVWGIFLASLALQAVALIFVKKVENRLDGIQGDSCWETVWNLIAYQLMQYQESLNFFSNAGRFLLIIFGVGHLILFLGLYQSYLISALLQDTVTLPFKDLNEMIQSVSDGHYQAVKIQNGNWIFSDIEVSPFFESMRSALKLNPWATVKDSFAGIDLLETGKYVMFNQIDAYSALYVFPKNRPIFSSSVAPEFLAKFNKQIIMQQSFILRTYNKYFDSGFKLSRRSDCHESSGNTGDFKVLGVMDCIGLFVVLLIGWAAAPFVFIAEIFVFKFVARKVTGRPKL